MPSTPELIAGVSAVGAVLAWFESRRMRRAQEGDFNFQREADIRFEQFKYFADRDLPTATKPRDELRFTVKNVGRAFAAEMNFAVDNWGMLRYVQMLIGLPPGTSKELSVTLPPDPELGPKAILLRYRYDDYRRHWGEVRLNVSDGSHRYYGQYRGPRIQSARLDGKRNLSIVEGGAFETPMTIPRWYDSLVDPYRLWRFRKHHPEAFERSGRSIPRLWWQTIIRRIKSKMLSPDGSRRLSRCLRQLR